MYTRVLYGGAKQVKFVIVELQLWRGAAPSLDAY